MTDTSLYKKQHRAWVNANPVRVKRQEDGLTLNELATAMSVHPCTLRFWENGTSEPNNENLETVARYLEVSSEEVRQMWQDWIDARPRVIRQ